MSSEFSFLHSPAHSIRYRPVENAEVSPLRGPVLVTHHHISFSSPRQLITMVCLG